MIKVISQQNLPNVSSCICCSSQTQIPGSNHREDRWMVQQDRSLGPHEPNWWAEGVGEGSAQTFRAQEFRGTSEQSGQKVQVWGCQGLHMFHLRQLHLRWKKCLCVACTGFLNLAFIGFLNLAFIGFRFIIFKPLQASPQLPALCWIFSHNL